MYCTSFSLHQFAQLAPLAMSANVVGPKPEQPDHPSHLCNLSELSTLRFFRISYGNSPLNTEYGNGPYYTENDPMHLLTSHLIDLQWHPASYLRSQFTSSSNFCTIICMGAGLGTRITERPPKMKIFTRNTENTVHGF